MKGIGTEVQNLPAVLSAETAADGIALPRVVSAGK
jgi:hypothetical protein